MDVFISNLKNKFKKNDDEGELFPVATDDADAATKRQEDVRQTLSKVDPNALVDVDDMVQLSESVNSSQGSAAEDDTNLDTSQEGNTLQRAFSILKKTSKDDLEEKPETMTNPIEDDVFIYYD